MSRQTYKVMVIVMNKVLLIITGYYANNPTDTVEVINLSHSPVIIDNSLIPLVLLNTTVPSNPTTGLILKRL